MSDHPPVPRAPSRPARALLVAALAVSALIAGLGWVFASSPGSAPDDDYHLVSTWCPRPIASSGCETTTIDGEVHVMAPVTTSHAQCEAFSPDKSHACINDYSDSMMFPSYRYNDGAYPYGFYQFHHLFAGASVEASAWHMRVVNVLIALVLLGGVCALAPASMRQGLFLAITLAWIPMGAYFIASNNPSSWAITGVFAYGSALFGALRSDGRRRWALLGIALVGALLCFGSRGDAAFYVFVVSLGVLIAVGRRDRIVEIAGASVLSAIGVWLMAGGGQAGTIASSSATVSLSERLAVAIINIRYLPEYFAGFAGLYSGPGWRDTPLPGACVVLGLMLLGAGVLIGGRAMTWRKAASLVVVLGAMAGQIGLILVLDWAIVGIPGVALSMMIGTPIAVLLGLRREAVGAAFSNAREPNIAIIGEKYGLDTPEGRGVMGVYVTGTIFGALFCSFLSSFVASTMPFFSPQALAMATGTGSASMMTAAVTPLVTMYPQLKDELLALASASNMFSGLDGVYMCVFLSLPIANWLVRIMGVGEAPSVPVGMNAEEGED